MSGKISVDFYPGAGFTPPTAPGAGAGRGDSAMLYSNGGSGAIDCETPVTAEIYCLFAGGAGIYGYGYAPYGRHAYGCAHAARVPGYGRCAYGRHPYGYGSPRIVARVEIDACGEYKFAFKTFDAAGNASAQPCEEAAIEVHTAPPAPTGLKTKSYNPSTDILVVEPKET